MSICWLIFLLLLSEPFVLATSLFCFLVDEDEVEFDALASPDDDLEAGWVEFSNALMPAVATTTFECVCFDVGLMNSFGLRRGRYEVV